MKLIKLSQYRKQYFVEGSEPSLRTLKRWIVSGEIKGEILNGHYYVTVDENGAVNPLIEALEQHV